MANKIDNAFKTAPPHQELRAMVRDLRFYPSTVVDPAALSAEQIAAYNRDGYIKGLRIFDEAEITKHRAFFDAQLQKALAAGQSSFTLSSAHLKFPKLSLIHI